MCRKSTYLAPRKTQWTVLMKAAVEAVEEAAAVQEGVVEAVKLSQWGFPKLAAASVGRRSEPSPHARRPAC